MALSVNEIAKIAGVSYATVRRYRMKLGRMPTIEEMIDRKGKRGRPNIEDEGKVAMAIIKNKRATKFYVSKLIEAYGEETTLKEINERID